MYIAVAWVWADSTLISSFHRDSLRIFFINIKHKTRDRYDQQNQLEAIKELEESDKKIIQEVLQGLIFKYQAKRWTTCKLIIH